MYRFLFKRKISNYYNGIHGRGSEINKVCLSISNQERGNIFQRTCSVQQWLLLKSIKLQSNKLEIHMYGKSNMIYSSSQIVQYMQGNFRFKRKLYWKNEGADGVDRNWQGY